MLQLRIVSPEKIEFDGVIESVIVPGTMGQFEILNDHAPIISSLEKGDIVYVSGGKESRLPIREGFVEVRDNQVDVCVEV